MSVANAAEAAAAVTGGADLVDAKDPLAGSLGAVSLQTLRDIYTSVAGARPVTAALGDAADEDELERAACSFASAGASFVKVGFSGIADSARVAALIGAAVRGANSAERAHCGVVAVAYADADRAGSLAPAPVAAAAARAGASGVLLDTADKSGPGLRDLVAHERLAEWVERTHDAGLFVALAGKLTCDDFQYLRDLRADIVGVRGAACDGGRTGVVSARRVRLLRALCSKHRAVASDLTAPGRDTVTAP